MEFECSVSSYLPPFYWRHGGSLDLKPEWSRMNSDEILQDIAGWLPGGNPNVYVCIYLFVYLFIIARL